MAGGCAPSSSIGSPVARRLTRRRRGTGICSGPSVKPGRPVAGVPRPRSLRVDLSRVGSNHMRGLSGEYTFDGRPADITAVDRMCEAMETRGPDDVGAYAHGPIAFGHRRLSIIDLSPAGHQPLVDPELGLAIAYNGCIYNYRELRDELAASGHRFFSNSDTEVSAKGYRQWGEDVVDHLIGMFAFAIHERDTGRLVLARDRLGIKPLYLAETRG